MQFLNLQALIPYHDLAIICLEDINLHPSLALNMHNFAGHHYDHPDGGMAVIVKDCIYCIPVNLNSPLHITTLHVHLLSLCFTLPPAVPLS
jgi:hypothetical protein